MESYLRSLGLGSYIKRIVTLVTIFGSIILLATLSNNGSKRMNTICNSESLWQNVNLTKRTVPAEFIEKILEINLWYKASLHFQLIFGVRW